MTEAELFERIDPVLRPLGSVPEDGEEYSAPPLNVLRYYHRQVRLHWVPLLGRASSVVAVVRQPVDVGLSAEGYGRFLKRVAMAVNGRYPPWRRGRGVAVGLTVVALTPEPIGPGDDVILQAVLGRPMRPRARAVPLGVLRLNLGQEAMSFALASGPEGLFPEAEVLADALTPHFRRFVPLLPP